ncbi:carboxy terminal-processing peptidase [Daejeonella oryzae]|uniref:carboxy terminal-processing peptidase n=1 Tax=Daejeonella oryzae TaxID=1122943 RepID=UPI000422A02D|nr:carboxy terminal-processing peptidase [Daejeonella oryzae]
MLKKVYLALFLVAALSCKAEPRVSTEVEGSPNLKPDIQQSIVAKELVNLIENYHYKKVTINDSFSSDVFDRYLKALDPGKAYFLQSDITEFEKFRNKLDDDLREGDLSAPFYIFNVYQKRYTDRLKYALSQIGNKFEFSQDDQYTYDREKLPWFATEKEALDLWNKRVKYELLNLKIAGTEDAKNVKTLKQRYENLLSQSSKINNQDVFQTIMNAFTEAVDPHTNYFVPNKAQEFNEELARTFEGIGARLQVDNEVVKVMEIIPGGPAFKAKTLSVNDRIVGVAQGKNGEFVDVVGWRIDVTVSKIKGPKGTVVRLKIIPAGQELSATPRIVELVRDKVVLEDQSAKKTIKTVTADGKSYKIGVIQIPAFYADFKAMQSGDKNYKSTTRDVRLLIDTLKQQKVDGIVIDLRSNGGGSLPEAISLTGLFIKTGPVVQVRDARNRIDVDEDSDPSIAWDGPMGVMVDRFSASASEIFAGAIQDYGRGIIMGTQTYGKGTVQQGIDMSRVIGPAEKLRLLAANKTNETGVIAPVSDAAPQFGQINLTMAKFYRINGSSTQHKGVMPDIQFPMVFPSDKYGESSEPSALPWDTIPPSKYVQVRDLTAIKKQLLVNHEQRMQTSPEYKFLKEDIIQFGKRDSETSITLNEAKLKKEREDQEAKNLARENQIRIARGLAPLKKGETKPKEESDFVQDASLRIIADFIQLKN